MNNPKSSETLHLNVKKSSKCFWETYKKKTWGALILPVEPVQIAKVCKRIENKVQISDVVKMALNHN